MAPDKKDRVFEIGHAGLLRERSAVEGAGKCLIRDNVS
jgi:hypothetical protein